MFKHIAHALDPVRLASTQGRAITIVLCRSSSVIRKMKTATESLILLERVYNTHIPKGLEKRRGTITRVVYSPESTIDR
jgi:hypothetical protein